MRHLLHFLIACWPCWLAAQPDTTFTKNSLKQPSRWWDNSGIYWRVGTGVRWFRETEDVAVGLPVQLEAGYKFHCLELGAQYSTRAAPLERDVDFNGNESIVFEQTQISSLRSWGWNVGLHARVFRIPWWVRYGERKLKMDRRLLQRTVFPDDSYQIDFVPNPKFDELPAPTSTKLRCFAAGIQQKSFWIGVEMDRWETAGGLDWTTSLLVGIQMSPGRDKAFENEQLDYFAMPRRWTLGVDRAFYYGWRNGHDVGSGVSVRVSRRFNAHSALALIGTSIREFGGNVDQKKEFKNNPKPIAVYRTGYWGEDAVTLRSELIYFPLPENPLSFFFTTGTGLYATSLPTRYVYSQRQEPGFLVLFMDYLDGRPQLKGSVGLSAGTGFHFRCFQSQLTLHKTMNRFPLFLEWSVGVKLSAGRMGH